MGHQISIDPVDDACIDISHMDNLGAFGFLATPSTQITSAMRQAYPCK